MKHLVLLSLISFSFAFCFQSNEQESISLESELIGKWQIDLRPTPDAEAYYQEFVVKSIKGNKMKGSFYGSTIKNGLINTQWEKIYYSFTSSDGTNDYYHSGHLENGMLIGISYCPGREFTTPWTGKKVH